MVTIGRILRDYRDAGSLNGLLALWGFVDDATFLTKAGHVGLVYQVRGIDYEGLSHAQRRALVHRLEGGLRMLDERCRLYQYLIKQTAAPVVSAPCQQPSRSNRRWTPEKRASARAITATGTPSARPTAIAASALRTLCRPGSGISIVPSSP